MRGNLVAGRVCGSRYRNAGLNRLSFGLRRGGTDVPPLLSGIDTIHDEPRIKPIAVEAFGRHLKGADASVPFSLDRFSKNHELPREWNDPILRLSYTRLGIGLQTTSLSSSLYSSRMSSVLPSSGQHAEPLLYLSHGPFTGRLPDKLICRQNGYWRHHGKRQVHHLE